MNTFISQIIATVTILIFFSYVSSRNRETAIIYKCPPDIDNLEQRCDININGPTTCTFENPNRNEIFAVLSDEPIDVVCNTGVVFFNILRKVLPALNGENFFNCRFVPKNSNTCITIEPRSNLLHCYSIQTGDPVI